MVRNRQRQGRGHHGDGPVDYEVLLVPPRRRGEPVQIAGVVVAELAGAHRLIFDRLGALEPRFAGQRGAPVSYLKPPLTAKT